jgi:hypothetical protein
MYNFHYGSERRLLRSDDKKSLGAAHVRFLTSINGVTLKDKMWCEDITSIVQVGVDNRPILKRKSIEDNGSNICQECLHTVFLYKFYFRFSRWLTVYVDSASGYLSRMVVCSVERVSETSCISETSVTLTTSKSWIKLKISVPVSPSLVQRIFQN